MFVVIDGHNGDVVGRMVRRHIMDVITRNRNVMVKRRYDKGMREVFMKMEELLASEHI